MECGCGSEKEVKRLWVAVKRIVQFLALPESLLEFHEEKTRVKVVESSAVNEETAELLRSLSDLIIDQVEEEVEDADTISLGVPRKRQKGRLLQGEEGVEDFRQCHSLASKVVEDPWRLESITFPSCGVTATPIFSATDPSATVFRKRNGTRTGLMVRNPHAEQFQGRAREDDQHTLHSLLQVKQELQTLGPDGEVTFESCGITVTPVKTPRQMKSKHVTSLDRHDKPKENAVLLSQIKEEPATPPEASESIYDGSHERSVLAVKSSKQIGPESSIFSNVLANIKRENDELPSLAVVKSEPQDDPDYDLEEPISMRLESDGVSYSMSELKIPHSPVAHVNGTLPLKLFPSSGSPSTSSAYWSQSVKLEGVTCSICNDGQRFTTKGVLARHMKNIHSNVARPIPCQHCSRVFKYIEGYRYHFQSVHEGKRFLCLHPGCNSAYSTVTAVRKHQRTKEHGKEHKIIFIPDRHPKAKYSPRQTVQIPNW